MIMASIKTAPSLPQYTQELPHDTQGQLAEVQARVAVQQLDKVLQKEVQDLKVLVDSKKKMYELINSNDKLKSRGYAGFMRGLAEVSSSDVSVTSFSLSGLNANISGVAARSESVPQLVSRFGSNENLQDITFGALKVETDKETGALRFSLSDTKEDDATDDEKGKKGSRGES